MPIPVATFTPNTAPISSAPDGALDKPLGQEIKYFNLWQEKQGLSFGDILDIINPLQHIPIVSSVYRALTGDTIGLASRLLGGGLFGGPAGIMVAGMQAALEGSTGKDLGGTVLAFLQDISGYGDQPAQVAAADPKAAGPAGFVPPAVEPAAGGPAEAGSATTATGGAGVTVAALAPGAALSANGDPDAEDYFGFASIYPAAGGAAAPATPPKQQASRQPVAASPLAQAPGRAPQAAKQQFKPAFFTGLAQRTGAMDAQSRRIMESIAQAQRAQAGILMASLSGDRAREKPGTGERSADSDDTAGNPVRRRPDWAPDTAAPQWTGRTMA